MKKLFFIATAGIVLLACNNKPADQASTTDSSATASTTPKPTPQMEISDAKYTEMGKKSMALLSSGDIDNWASQFSDNAVYLWSAGDSLAGKAAIIKYWKERRGNVIDSLVFSNDIWLPIKVNQPQRGPDLPGIWLFNWMQVNVKYKNGKKLMFWEHIAYHYNSNDQVDRVAVFLDRAPINAATKK